MANDGTHTARSRTPGLNSGFGGAAPQVPAGARRGTFIARHVDPCAEDQVQPNGVDLRIGEVFTVTSPAEINADGTVPGERQEVAWPPENCFPPGFYIIRYQETVTIPPGHVGQVFPRSSLLRNGAALFSALWDQGYSGRGEALMVLWAPMKLPPGARIGQLVMFPAEAAAGYEGQYQGENLD